MVLPPRGYFRAPMVGDGKGAEKSLVPDLSFGKTEALT
jgi:hypothetical protein